MNINIEDKLRKPISCKNIKNKSNLKLENPNNHKTKIINDLSRLSINSRDIKNKIDDKKLNERVNGMYYQKKLPIINNIEEKIIY